MSLLTKLRSLPLKTRRNLALTMVIFLSGIGIIIWASTDFGLSGQKGGLGTIKEGAGDVASLIQEQSDQFQSERVALEENLNQVLKSAALIYPEGLIGENEEPTGVLYLDNEYREKGVKTVLQQVEFYKSATLAYFQVELSGDSNVFIDAAQGSVLAQTVESTGTELTFQPLFQAGSPTELKPGDLVDILVLFGPVNGRDKFKLVLGDFTTSTDPEIADRWSAKFSIDPSKIIEKTEESETPVNSPIEP